MRTLTSLALLAILCLPCPVTAERGPSTPEERARALEAVRILESSPQSAEAKAELTWMLQWLVEVPDVTVHACFDLLGSKKAREGIPTQLAMQQAFSSAGYMLEHDGAEPDSIEVLEAGVGGVLRAYQSMRAAGGMAESSLLEDLLAKEQNGELAKYVAKRKKHCR